jgi:hypothetical protein
LAERLGCTQRELMQRMDSAEFTVWKAREELLAERRAEAGKAGALPVVHYPR